MRLLRFNIRIMDFRFVWDLMLDIWNFGLFRARRELRNSLRIPVVVCLLLLILGVPETTSAHVEGNVTGGFLSGLAHPISGLDHVLAMIAVGLWGAQLGNPAMWLLPIAFPMMMAFGGMLGLIGVPIPGIEIGIAVSAIVLGIMVLSEAKPQLYIALVIVAFFAIFHGHAHGTELTEGESALFYSIGFVISTGCLHGVGIAIGLLHYLESGKKVLKAAGAIVAAGGIYFLWRALFG